MKIVISSTLKVRFAKLIAQLAKTDVLLLDDWGLEKMTLSQRNDLLEIMEDRHGLKSTVVTSQLPVSSWHEVIGEPTIADSILDRLVHQSHRIELEGQSLRKAAAQKAKKAADKPPNSTKH